jgi:hypothetical protein
MYADFQAFESDLQAWYDEAAAKKKERMGREMAMVAMDEKKRDVAAARAKSGPIRSLVRALSRKLSGKAAPSKASEMRAAGARVAELVQAGCTWREIFELSAYRRDALAEGGFVLQDLKVAGCRQCQITATLLRGAGFPAVELLEAGFSEKALLRADYDLCPSGGGECNHVMHGDDGSGHPTHTVCSKCGATHRA